MRYEVRAVADSSLPEGTDWAIARVAEGVFLFVKQSRFACEKGMCELMAEVWRASAMYGAGLPPGLPVAV